MKTLNTNSLTLGFSAVLIGLMVACGGSEETKTTTDDKKNVEKEITVEEPVESTLAASTFGNLLVELESNMGWESVNEAWTTRREGWVAECMSVTEVAAKGDLLLEFESMVEWSAVDKGWAKIREDWSNDVANATTDKELANLLVIFESYVLWDVVSPNWVNLREDWIKRCGEVEA